MQNKIRLIASYLPQFYPTKENNEWWGPGFTEWTNVGKAEKLFKDHYQPRIPADLGYYDLRLVETRVEQAKMAQEYGIEGFCYWHYWFGNGKRILDRVFDEVLKTGCPDFPFCLGWANETWSGVWHGAKNKILLEQTYPGKADYKMHFEEMLPAFQDSRYIRVDDKPLFMIYKPELIPDAAEFISYWRELAAEAGLGDFYFVGQTIEIEKKSLILEMGFDAINVVRLYDYRRKEVNILSKGYSKLFGSLNVYDYEVASRNFSGEEDRELDCIPTIIPNWDHSPRSGKRAYILHNSTPELFRKHVREVFDTIKDKPAEHRIAFVKSWNEWGEGNHLEPDLRFGKEYLKVLKSECDKV
ncbi:glycoside hydrolase family 99-like domain-containing protein [Sphingobacterium sp. 18053]|uniref:glycosyltransferase WbsX family protein n=1 Tax=Sphingobacterium sp. 18053 TaxID=2681401 RepID=UPI00135C8B21|nr:glycoside hydrolase family 99-like domain-containing protein [Sphingobacterium sp. 18053]